MQKLRMVDLISKKKAGEAHSVEEIKFIVDGVKNNSIPDYQLSAWLMAVCLKGMTFDESAMLTEAMAKSGEIIDLSALGEYISDKHSTGGVGDKTTLILAPLLASVGVKVAKLSGRGLGYTGGTIDKLESIEGYNPSLELDKFIEQVNTIGAAVISQTAKLAPADSRLYALRDVTATVDSIPLIASSVLSKKIASGANVIVLDVKYGSGAFMKTPEQAEELSKTMVEIGKKLNRSITAVITSMDQPLGNGIGNAIEVQESIDTLKNIGPKDLTDLSVYLAAVMMVNTKNAKTIEEAEKALRESLANGKAYSKFIEMVEAQSAVKNFVLPTAEHLIEVKADSEGFITETDALTIAKASKILGAGRETKEDPIDYAVGVVLTKKIGDKVAKGDTIAVVHANSLELGKDAVKTCNKAFKYSSTPVEVPPIVHKVID
ncbi:MAG: thymidine phosphorylase [bacterium]